MGEPNSAERGTVSVPGELFVCLVLIAECGKSSQQIKTCHFILTRACCRSANPLGSTFQMFLLHYASACLLVLVNLEVAEHRSSRSEAASLNQVTSGPRKRNVLSPVNCFALSRWYLIFRAVLKSSAKFQEK